MRVASWIVVGVLSVLACVGLAVLGRHRGTIVPTDALDAQYAAELAIATDQGLVAAPEQSVTTWSAQIPLRVEVGECVALVAAAYGGTSVELEMDVGPTVADGFGYVVHAAACAVEDRASEITLRWAPSLYEVEQHLRYTVLRGRLRDPRSYTRLVLSEAQRGALDAAAVRARLSERMPVASRIGDEHVATTSRAVLVPPTRASWAGLRSLAGRRDIVPAVETGDDPFAATTDTSVPPRVFVPSGQARVIAVVDAGALGTACVDIAFARLDAPATAEPIDALSIPDLASHTTGGADPAISVDRICPARGLFVYTVPEGAGADVVVVVSRVEGDGPAEPSHFGDEVGGRHPSGGLAVLPVALVASSRAACAAGDADACFALAALASERIEGAGTIGEALRPLCDRTGGVACDVLAGLDADTTAAETLERRACATGVPDACMRRGARLLASARDLAGAHAAFAYGCAQGSADCCSAQHTMEGYELAAPSSGPPGPP